MNVILDLLLVIQTIILITMKAEVEEEVKKMARKDKKARKPNIG